MVRYRRNHLPGGTFFFTTTLRNRRSTALTDNIALLRHAFQDARSRRPFQIDAVVVLPDHLHTIWTLPLDDTDYSARWQRIKGVFTQEVIRAGGKYSRDDRGEYDLWQRRFWEHTIRDDVDMRRCVDYIHFNPVKHGLARRVIDWQHSSFHRYVEAGILPYDWSGNATDIVEDFGEPIG